MTAIDTNDERGRASIVRGRMMGGDYVFHGVAARLRFYRKGREAIATGQVTKVRQ